MNHLKTETSPYLIQHANNPVDWYPWCNEAIQKAKTLNKPILLSIGYSSCHWCHVMAAESFSNNETAKIMNELFINIKVDREERPDLDKIYQTAHQLLTHQSGGWPLTIFLTPEGHPFFSGTYFPSEPRHGLPSFNDILKQVHHAYTTQKDSIERQKQQLQDAFRFIYQSSLSKKENLNIAPISQFEEYLSYQYDTHYGGFVGAPKFPQSMFLHAMLNSHKNDLVKLALHGLEKMRKSGLYDQLGGGFFRYCVDEAWTIPHFEKMLYDSALLLPLYTDAFLMTQDDLFKITVLQTAYWVIHHMQAKDGGYFTSLDAQSEGIEGQYYCWDPTEIKTILNENEWNVISILYGLDQTPNFNDLWHLIEIESLNEIKSKTKHNESEISNLITSAKAKLLAHREDRIKPHRDEKILTSWNALMIKALLRSGYHFNQEPLIQSAEQSLQFIFKNLWEKSILFASFQAGKPKLHAYLDDYVFLIDALLTKLQVHWNTDDLHFAIALTDTLLSEFEDPKQGGFYFTSNTHDALLTRPKIFSDETLPSGNGIAARVLFQLGYLIGNTRYLESAEKILRSAWEGIQSNPEVHPTLLSALDEYFDPSEIIILRGHDSETTRWKDISKSYHHPKRSFFKINDDEYTLPQSINEKKTIGKVSAFICRGLTCHDTITEYDDFLTFLKNDTV